MKVSKQEQAQSDHPAKPREKEPHSERDLRSDPTPAPDPSPVPDPMLPTGPTGPEPLPGILPRRPGPAAEASGAEDVPYGSRAEQRRFTP